MYKEYHCSALLLFGDTIYDQQGGEGRGEEGRRGEILAKVSKAECISLYNYV